MNGLSVFLVVSGIVGLLWFSVNMFNLAEEYKNDFVDQLDINLSLKRQRKSLIDENLRLKKMLQSHYKEEVE